METLALATLYKIRPASQNASLEVIGGTVDIYGSHKLPSSPPTDMDKTAENFVGIDGFGTFPQYLYIEQNTGTTTDIILIGVASEIV